MMSKVGWIIGGVVATGAALLFVRHVRAQASTTLPQSTDKIVYWSFPVREGQTVEEAAARVHNNRAELDLVAKHCIGLTAQFVGTEVIRGDAKVRVIFGHTEPGLLNQEAIQVCLDQAL